jgi:hypothetical protein
MHARLMLPCGSGMYNFKSARVVARELYPGHDTGVPNSLARIIFRAGTPQSLRGGNSGLIQ